MQSIESRHCFYAVHSSDHSFCWWPHCVLWYSVTDHFRGLTKCLPVSDHIPIVLLSTILTPHSGIPQYWLTHLKWYDVIRVSTHYRWLWLMTRIIRLWWWSILLLCDISEMCPLVIFMTMNILTVGWNDILNWYSCSLKYCHCYSMIWTEASNLWLHFTYLATGSVISLCDVALSIHLTVCDLLNDWNDSRDVTLMFSISVHVLAITVTTSLIVSLLFNDYAILLWLLNGWRICENVSANVCGGVSMASYSSASKCGCGIMA